MDGIININKPSGRTSFSIVAQVKRVCGARRAGHAGTLDPMATGVLPVCVNQATRVIEFLMDTTKAYTAEVTLGAATDTYDSSGQVTSEGDTSGIGREQVEAALAPFRGNIRQTPPMYSALKRQGRPLYELARAGISVERKSRPVQIHHLELTGWQPPAAIIEVECSKGTYIRSLAHDLGQSLDCGAHLTGLVRTRCGIFKIEDAVTPDHLEETWPDCQERYLYPVDAVLQHLGAVVADEVTEALIRQGSPVSLEDSGNISGEYCRVYNHEGRFLAVLRRLPDTALWQPKKVFTL